MYKQKENVIYIKLVTLTAHLAGAHTFGFEFNIN